MGRDYHNGFRIFTHLNASGRETSSECFRRNQNKMFSNLANYVNQIVQQGRRGPERYARPEKEILSKSADILYSSLDFEDIARLECVLDS